MRIDVGCEEGRRVLGTILRARLWPEGDGVHFRTLQDEKKQKM
jgi:hypothetical protein